MPQAVVFWCIFRVWHHSSEIMLVQKQCLDERRHEYWCFNCSCPGVRYKSWKVRTLTWIENYLLNWTPLSAGKLCIVDIELYLETEEIFIKCLNAKFLFQYIIVPKPCEMSPHHHIIMHPQVVDSSHLWLGWKLTAPHCKTPACYEMFHRTPDFIFRKTAGNDVRFCLCGSVLKLIPVSGCR